MQKLVFKPNPRQQEALEALYDPKNKEGEPFDPDNPPAIELVVENGKLQLVVSEAYLHADGEWATFPEGLVDELRTYDVNASLTVESTGAKHEVETALFDVLAKASESSGVHMENMQIDVVTAIEQARSVA